MATTPQRRAGIVTFLVNGVQHDAIGNFTYNSGREKREGLPGADRVHGFKSTVQVPFIEGEIRDRGDLDVPALQGLEDGTITLALANGKTFVLRNAWWAADGDIGTEEANIQARWEGLSGEENADV